MQNSGVPLAVLRWSA